MSVAGIENEYGVSLDGVHGDRVDPITLSAAVVTAGTSLASRWDYATESPLRDARGYHLPRDEAVPDLLTDETRYANRLLGNGARFYVDHAHPEYSGPEVTSARDAVAWDRAGDQIVQAAAGSASETLGARVRVWKNTTDGKGQSYGCHENHLVPRSVPFDAIVDGFTTHLVSRVPFTGAGRVGLGQRGDTAGFQISQRADFFEARVGLETTVNRPLVNTRDEPHADVRRWRRLHVITGDALVGQWGTWLKVGAVSLVLQAIAAGVRWPKVLNPVAAFRAFSHDPTLQQRWPCSDGVERTALDLQDLLWRACSPGTETWLDDDHDVHRAWGEAIADARRDPATLADRVDWAAKYRLLQGLARRGGLAWTDARLAALDLQWADLDPEKGIGLTLERQGALRTVVTEAEVAHARVEPPSTTRAWLRGWVLHHFAGSIVQATWDQFTVHAGGRVVTVRLPEPLDHTAARWDHALDDVTDPAEMLRVLESGGARLERS
ncbi:depupylase/deamidase Dop [Aestuariimicrobium soli]|uniref:depupylase/deamidase Dop n=1 Tax=Aestuariimicrobium soli TaxID=2035834 RepID=UPI003EBBE1ED